MTAWTSTPMAHLIRVNGVWLRTDACEAIATTSAGSARVHLTGGSTVDVPLHDGQSIDYVARALYPNETAR